MGTESSKLGLGNVVKRTNATTNLFLQCGGHDDDSDCMAKRTVTNMLAASSLKDGGTESKLRLRDKQDTLECVSARLGGRTREEPSWNMSIP